MKKLTALLMALCLLSVTAYADMIVEPNDKFWESHRRECDYYYRSYTLNSPEGYVSLWESPVSSAQRENVRNGSVVSGRWHYTDKTGEVWCAVYGGGYGEKGENIRGWVKTSECVPVPDHISFREVHEEEFVKYDPAYDGALQGVDTVVLWSYPCSGSGGEFQSMNWVEPGKALPVQSCWKDAQGRMWGYLEYWYGRRDVWVCLDDLSNADIEADESLIPQSVLYPPSDHVPLPRSKVSVMTVVTAVAAVAFATVMLLRYFVKKPRTKAAEG